MVGLNLRLDFPCPLLAREKIVDVTFFYFFISNLATNHFASHHQQLPTTNKLIANMDVSKRTWNRLTDRKTG